MIIFNLFAIPVGLVIYLILLGVERWIPSLMTDPHRAWTIGVVITIVGGLTEWFGIAGRVFFLPIWMAGIGILCYQLGWAGMITFGAILIIGLIWVSRRAKKKEAEEWQKAQQELIRASAPSSSGSERQFWEWVKSVLFLPIMMDYTPDICEHDLKVLQAIAKAKPLLAPEEAAKLAVFQVYLSTSGSSAKPLACDMKLRGAVDDLLEKKLRKANANAPLQVAPAAPPPLIPSR